MPQNEWRGSPFPYRTASPPKAAAAFTTPLAILRSVDRNSSKLSSMEKKSNNTNRFRTPQKQQQQRTRSSSRAGHLDLDLMTDECVGGGGAMPRRGGAAGVACSFTPNSTDMDVCAQEKHSKVGGTMMMTSERPQCTNPVGATLWHHCESYITHASESACESPAAPVVMALSSPAKLVRPMATRSFVHPWSGGGQESPCSTDASHRRTPPSGVC